MPLLFFSCFPSSVLRYSDFPGAGAAFFPAAFCAVLCLVATIAAAPAPAAIAAVIARFFFFAIFIPSFLFLSGAAAGRMCGGCSLGIVGK
jgi:hypothetical protein